MASTGVDFIKLDVDLFENRKLRHLARKCGPLSTLLWVKLLCLAGQCNEKGRVYIMDGVPYDTETLADDLGMEAADVDTMLAAMARLGMILLDDDGYITEVVGWADHQNVDGMERAKEKARLRQAKYRENHRTGVEPSPTPTESVTPASPVEDNAGRDVTVTSRNGSRIEIGDKRQETREQEYPHGERKNTATAMSSPAHARAKTEAYLAWKSRMHGPTPQDVVERLAEIADEAGFEPGVLTEAMDVAIRRDRMNPAAYVLTLAKDWATHDLRTVYQVQSYCALRAENTA